MVAVWQRLITTTAWSTRRPTLVLLEHTGQWQHLVLRWASPSLCLTTFPGWKLRQNWNGVSSLRSQEIGSCGVRPHEAAIRSYGGLALCYRVRHLALGDIYALKVCNTAGASAVQASEQCTLSPARYRIPPVARWRSSLSCTGMLQFMMSRPGRVS